MATTTYKILGQVNPTSGSVSTEAALYTVGSNKLGAVVSTITVANTGNAGAGTLVSLPQNSLIIPEGIQIRIPSNYANIIRNFNAINA